MKPFTVDDLENALKELDLKEFNQPQFFATQEFWLEFDEACISYVKQLKNI